MRLIISALLILIASHNECVALCKEDCMFILKDTLDGLFSRPVNEWIFSNRTTSYNYYYVNLQDDEDIIVAFEGHPDPTNKYAIVYVRQGEEAVLLNSESGLPVISEIVRRDYAAFPEDSDARYNVINAIKSMYIMPEGKIGSKKFFHGTDVDRFLIPGKCDRGVFEKYCTDPQFSVDGENNSWEVLFFLFNVRGGVDRITMNGKVEKFSVDEVKIDIELKPGSFSYRYYL